MQSFNFYLYNLVYIHIRGRRLRLLRARAACNQVIPKTQRFCPEAWRALNSRRHSSRASADEIRRKIFRMVLQFQILPIQSYLLHTLIYFNSMFSFWIAILPAHVPLSPHGRDMCIQIDDNAVESATLSATRGGSVGQWCHFAHAQNPTKNIGPTTLTNTN